MPDFNENQFVIARTMLTNSNNKAVIVGMLCECKDIKKYKDYSWITVKGVIKKGDYNGDIPVLEVFEIKDSSIPEDEFVYTPED